jgi:hypothetical protein
VKNFAQLQVIDSSQGSVANFFEMAIEYPAAGPVESHVSSLHDERSRPDRVVFFGTQQFEQSVDFLFSSTIFRPAQG